jgi:UDP-N-acetylmuramoylalanine--D-glutamate ligase
MKKSSSQQDPRVLVLGLGVSGLSTIVYLARQGKSILAVNSGPLGQWKDSVVEKLNLGPTLLNNIEFLAQDELVKRDNADIELVILSPGLPRELDCLKVFHDQGIEVINEIELAYKKWTELGGGPILAVTGSNGKTTTCSLMAHLLTASGKRPFLGGNIGRPFVEALDHVADYDCAVLELSSFQLESLFEFEAQARAILNFSFTHGERYQSLLDYGGAKLRLLNTWRAGQLFLMPSISTGPKEEEFNELLALTLKQSGVEKLSYDEEWLSSVLPLEEFKLLGEHNRENLYVAVKLILHCYPELQEVLGQGVKSFVPPEHRLEQLPSKSGRLIVNDSKSTNWVATQTALKAMSSHASCLLMLGGQKRGANDSILPYLSSLVGGVEQFICFGESGLDLHRELVDQGIASSYFSSVREALEFLSSHESKAPILFSPAFPSFDQFKNYIDRGESFKNWARELLF